MTLLTADQLALSSFARSIDVAASTVRRWVGEGLPVDRSTGIPRVRVRAANAWVKVHKGKSVALRRVSHVYVARGADGKIKIGFTSNLDRRMRELCKESRQEVRLVATIRGDAKVERELHRRCAQWSVFGEWYRVDMVHVLKALKEFA